MKTSLEKANQEYIKRWKERGNKTTYYKCQHCKKQIETPQPSKKMVDSRGFWDSAKVCSNCGKLNFVAVYPNGKTRIFPIHS